MRFVCPVCGVVFHRPLCRCKGSVVVCSRSCAGRHNGMLGLVGGKC
jgi:hypothetical protein